MLLPHGAAVNARYLAARLNPGAPGEFDPATHTKYALALSAAVAAAAAAAAPDDDDRLVLREKLRRFLSSSRLYSPVDVLAAIDPGSKTSSNGGGESDEDDERCLSVVTSVDPGVVPELVVLHGRLGDHAAALRLLLHGPRCEDEQGDVDASSGGRNRREVAAERYCEEQARLSGDSTGDEQGVEEDVDIIMKPLAKVVASPIVDDVVEVTTSAFSNSASLSPPSSGIVASGALLLMYMGQSPPNFTAAARLFSNPRVRVAPASAADVIPEAGPSAYIYPTG